VPLWWILIEVNTLSDNYKSFEYDVLVIGAGGAGLRAAIEASAAGCKTGLVCKSLLGKAHTVMAEGGIAAALATVDSRDTWQQHFVDSMIGGNLGNHWRMAQIHAQQSPDRVRELEKWGAVFDRTNDGKGNINVRHFGGHTYKRLAHVGHPTGLELIRTLQDKGVHSGIEVHMECTIYALLNSNRENQPARIVPAVWPAMHRATPRTGNRTSGWSAPAAPAATCPPPHPAA